MPLEYVHVDVFSRAPYGGNGLPVFPDARGLSGAQMLAITREMRQFESVFLEPASAPNTVRARVFDLFEELPFAGHPLIGAAAVLHLLAPGLESRIWRVEMPEKIVTVTTQASAEGYVGMLDQGAPAFFGQVSARGQRDLFARAFSLEPDDLRPDLPLDVISTGLRYLVIPVQPGALARARIAYDLTDILRGIQAKFAFLLDPEAPEIRHWNNDGQLEDVATGSAAGVAGVYLLRHGLARGGDPINLYQGRFTGRPSVLRVRPEGTADALRTVLVGGDVALVGRGVLEALP